MIINIYVFNLVLRLSGSIPITSLLIINVYVSTGIMLVSSVFCNIISDNMKSVMEALS